MKPGFKTTEFYLSLAAMILGAVAASGLIPADGPWLQILGLATSMLAGLGYTGQRMVIKSGERRAKASETAAESYAKAAALVKDAGPTDG